MLLKRIPSMSTDPLKGDIQSCHDKHEEDIPKSSPFDFVIKQFKGKRSSPGRSKDQPSAIKKIFRGFDFGKSEGKDRKEIEETEINIEINNSGADDQREKQDPAVEGNAGTIMKYVCMCVYFNFIENQLVLLLAKMLYFAADSLSFSQGSLLIGTL